MYSPESACTCTVLLPAIRESQSVATFRTGVVVSIASTCKFRTFKFDVPTAVVGGPGLCERSGCIHIVVAFCLLYVCILYT